MIKHIRRNGEGERDGSRAIPRKFSNNRGRETIEKESWNFDKRKKKLPDAAAALISIRRVSPKVVRDDECEALGRLQEKAAGSRVADNTQREIFSSRCFGYIESNGNIASSGNPEEKKAAQCKLDGITYDVTTDGRRAAAY